MAKTRQTLGMRGRSRECVPVVGVFALRESQETYGGNFAPENRPIAAENGYFWEDCPRKSAGWLGQTPDTVEKFDSRPRASD